jgi:uncharacterized protein (DUF1697 family)
VNRHILLLRGINVGGHRRIAMAELRDLLARLGYEGARTHLQSGNVVLASSASPEQVRKNVERGISAELGDGVEVFVRTPKELADVIDRNPLRELVDNPSRYIVTFLSGKPDAAAVRNAKSADVGGERFAVVGREIYGWYPDGVQNAKLTKLLCEKRIGVRATARNWNTVVKLLELVEGE